MCSLRATVKAFQWVATGYIASKRRLRGRSSTWTLVPVELEHFPEGLRPAQERLDPDYPPAVPRRRDGDIIRHPSEDLRDLGARGRDLDLNGAAERLRATPSPPPPSSSNVIDRSRVPPARPVGRPTQAPRVPTRRRARGRG